MTAETSNARGDVLVAKWQECSCGFSDPRGGYESCPECGAALAAEGVQAGDGCHCGTCTCDPNMTPAVRFDLSPAQHEGAIREHLIRLGWTPPVGTAEDMGVK